MTPERWQEVDRLFQAAIELSPEKRSGFLGQACNGDDELRKEVESLLEQEEPARDFLRDGAIHDAAKDLASEDPIGQRLGQYEVLALIGSGGMGDVYKGRHLTLKNEVALKFLPSQ